MPHLSNGMSAVAPAPRPDIDWAKLDPSQNRANNGHIEVRHAKSTNTWCAPALVRDPDILVSGLSSGLNYGQQCYEGLKAFRHPDGSINVFRPQFHAKRLARSAAALCLPPPPTALFIEAIRAAVAANAEFVPPADIDACLYIRPVLFGSSASAALGPPETTILAVYVLPLSPYHGSTALDAVVLDDFDRAAPRGMGSFKVGGNYAPVWRHVARAKDMGFGITLHLDSAEKSYVEEFSTSAFLAHKQDSDGLHVLVAPMSNNIIASVTRDSIIQLARQHESWRVEEQPLRFTSLTELDEVVAAGTAVSAVSVRSITRIPTEETYLFTAGQGNLVGLAKRLASIQRGQHAAFDDWCYKVTGFSG